MPPTPTPSTPSTAPCPVSPGPIPAISTTRCAPRQPRREHRAAVRGLWIAAGLMTCALGFIGLVVPGLPSTVFFILAAGCFSRSSERLHRWLISLPRIGPMVCDYHAGLGMPRSAKIWATAIMTVCVSLGALALAKPWQVAITISAAAVGAVYIWSFVPTQAPQPPHPTRTPTPTPAPRPSR